MSQSLNVSSGAVAGVNNLSYLNQNEPSQVLSVPAKRAPNANDKRYKIGTQWIDTQSNQAYLLLDVNAGQANWMQISSPGAGISTLTGNSGGAISPTGGNVNLLGGTGVNTVGSGSTITFNVTTDIPDRFATDSGVAIPASNILTIAGGTGIATSGAGSTVTVSSSGSVPTSFTEDTGTATPAANNLNVTGGTGIHTTGSGSTVTVATTAAVPLSFPTDSGTATPAANALTLHGASGITISGSGSTVTVTGSGTSNPPITPFVVGPTGGYATVQAGINACNAGGGGLVFVQKGTYTENLSLFNGVHLMGVPPADGAVTFISGTHTLPSGSGQYGFTFLDLQSSGDLFSGGTGAQVRLTNCSVGWGSANFLFNMGANAQQLVCTNVIPNGGGGGGIINSSSLGSLTVYDSILGGGGSSSTTTSGQIKAYNSQFLATFTLSGSSSFQAYGCTFFNTVTYGGTYSLFFTSCDFLTQSSSCIVVNSTSTFGRMYYCNFDSSATNAIDGTTGTVNLVGGQFSNTGGINAAVTIAGATTFANSSSGVSTGLGTIHMNSGNPATSSGWLKVFVNGAIAWIPTFTTNAP